MLPTQPFFIVGLGSQAKAWALNLKDSGYAPVVGLRADSSSFKVAESMNLEVASLEREFFSLIGESKLARTWVALLIPDHEIPAFFSQYHAHFSGKEAFLLAHGASYEKVRQNYPDIQIGLLAPKAIASELRFRYETKGALGAAIAKGTLGQEQYQILPTLCRDLGINAGPFEVTIKAETDADLFSEQALLCGLMPYAFRAAFEKMRQENIPEELAFMECWVEGQLIANTLCERGPEAFFNLISPNALLGAQLASQELIDEKFKQTLEYLWQEIDSGRFLAQAQQMDVAAVRAEVRADWAQSELTHSYNRLKEKFYPTRK